MRVARPSMCQRPGQQLLITKVQPQSHNHVTRKHRPQIFCFFPTRATDPCQPPLDETPPRRSAASPFPPFYPMTTSMMTMTILIHPRVIVIHVKPSGRGSCRRAERSETFDGSSLEQRRFRNSDNKLQATGPQATERFRNQTGVKNDEHHAYHGP